MLLADLGAEVIKVEGPAGDDTRHWVPPVRDGVGTYYLAVNRNKRSIVLDLKDPADLEVAHALSARADVFIQNFKPGGLTQYRLGLRLRRRPQPEQRVLLDQRLRGRWRSRPARVRPPGPGDVRADEPDRLTRTGRPTGPGSRSST